MSFPIPSDLVALLSSARRVAVLTGAGISKESGVPTFREKQTGLWERYRPEDLVSIAAFERNPRLVWEWHAQMAAAMAAAEPNAGHRAIVDLGRRIPTFTLITQNIDGMHQRAGSPAVIELHGNIGRVICSVERTPVERFSPAESPPKCAHCGAFLRHDVVWFGEPLPEAAIEAAAAAASDCEVFFSVGTSAVVQPAASLPYLALEHGATVVEINPEETPLSRSAKFALRAPAGTALPALVEALSS